MKNHTISKFFALIVVFAMLAACGGGGVTPSAKDTLIDNTPVVSKATSANEFVGTWTGRYLTTSISSAPFTLFIETASGDTVTGKMGSAAIYGDVTGTFDAVTGVITVSITRNTMVFYAKFAITDAGLKSVNEPTGWSFYTYGPCPKQAAPVIGDEAKFTGAWKATVTGGVMFGVQDPATTATVVLSEDNGKFVGNFSTDGVSTLAGNLQISKVGGAWFAFLTRKNGTVYVLNLLTQTAFTPPITVADAPDSFSLVLTGTKADSGSTNDSRYTVTFTRATP